MTPESMNGNCFIRGGNFKLKKHDGCRPIDYIDGGIKTREIREINKMRFIRGEF